MRYRDYGGQLLALELVTAVAGKPLRQPSERTQAASDNRTRSGPTQDKTVSQYLEKAPESLANLFADLDATLNAFGDDVQRITRKNYFAYRRLRNFACVEVHPRDHCLLVYAKVDPSTVALEDGFTRDVRSIGHFGTGDLEIRIRDQADLERASDLLLHSYQDN